jgi:hypothetical protein
MAGRACINKGKIMTDDMDGPCSPILEMKNVHHIVVGSPAAKR